MAAAVNPTSPTAFNTLSNVYVTAIDRATPVTAINTSASQSLKIQTQDLNKEQQHHGSHTPYAPTYLDTPLTAQPLSPGAIAPAPVQFPSTMTATPPLSSGPVDDSDPKPFSFSAEDTAGAAEGGASGPSWAPGGFPPSSASTPTGTSRRRATLPLSVSNSSGLPLPYVRNRSLHSILRNSPLPPPTARTPISPRRQSLRLAEKAARRVGYGSPIEQEITTNEYVRSHIDLLADEVSPRSATSPSGTTIPGGGAAAGVVSSPLDQMVLDTTMAYTGDETRDGGQTPGPFEEMRRRMAGLVTRTPTSPTVPSTSSPSGIRKRRKTTTRESKRRWVWTIGTQEDDADDREVGGAIAAIRAAARAEAQAGDQAGTNHSSTADSSAATAAAAAAATAVAPPPAMEIPTPSIETFDEAAHHEDVVMSESDAEAEAEGEAAGSGGGRGALAVSADMEVDAVTPTVARRNNAHLRSVRQDSEGLFNSETGSRRDTPIPADLIS